MIIIDIYAPAVDKTYNFSVNEAVSIRSVILEVIEMIEQKERVVLVGDKKGLHFFDKKKECPLPMDNTLNECMIKRGDRLILI